MRNIFVIGRKFACIGRLVYFRYSLEYVTPSYVENKYPVWFDYTDYLISINPFTTKPGYLKISIEYILTKSAMLLKVKLDLMLVNTTNDMFPLTSVMILQKVLTLCNPVHIETLAVIYCNSGVALKWEKLTDVSQIHKIMVFM